MRVFVINIVTKVAALEAKYIAVLCVKHLKTLHPQNDMHQDKKGKKPCTELVNCLCFHCSYQTDKL